MSLKFATKPGLPREEYKVVYWKTASGSWQVGLEDSDEGLVLVRPVKTFFGTEEEAVEFADKLTGAKFINKGNISR